MYGKLKDFLTQELANIKAAGLYKNERIITTPQRADIKVNTGSSQTTGSCYLRLFQNRRYNPVRCLFRCQRWSVRTAVH